MPRNTNNDSDVRPSRHQLEATRAAVAWYLRRCWRTEDDVGTPAMFFDADRVGEFAITPADYRRGAPEALFKLLVAVSVFQRLRDQNVLSILRKASKDEVRDLTDADALVARAGSSACPACRTLDGLRWHCDLTKTIDTRRGVCSAVPAGACHLHRHTEILRRYGHFGKVPTSIALALREQGVSNLANLYVRSLERCRGLRDRAASLEAILCRSWRINQKIASMFLSLVSVPGLSRVDPPWRRGLAWDYFVVIDINVERFLTSIGYDGAPSYDARRHFVQALAQRIDLRAHSRRLHSYNPRIVQQAAYAFMGASNRRAAQGDCLQEAPAACQACRPGLRTRCPVRPC